MNLAFDDRSGGGVLGEVVRDHKMHAPPRRRWYNFSTWKKVNFHEKNSGLLTPGANAEVSCSRGHSRCWLRESENPKNARILPKARNSGNSCPFQKRNSQKNNHASKFSATRTPKRNAPKTTTAVTAGPAGGYPYPYPGKGTGGGGATKGGGV